MARVCKDAFRPFVGLNRTTSDHERCAVVGGLGRVTFICAVLVRDSVMGGVTDLAFRLLSKKDDGDIRPYYHKYWLNNQHISDSLQEKCKKDLHQSVVDHCAVATAFHLGCFSFGRVRFLQSGPKCSPTTILYFPGSEIVRNDYDNDTGLLS